jgi:hypothetical protein
MMNLAVSTPTNIDEYLITRVSGMHKKHSKSAIRTGQRWLALSSGLACRVPQGRTSAKTLKTKEPNWNGLIDNQIKQF